MNGYLNAIALTVDYLAEAGTTIDLSDLKADVLSAIDRDIAKDKENAALKARVKELEKYKEFHSLVCTITATNFIKANAIREAGDSICNFRGSLENTATREEIYEHADRVERGES